MRSLDAAGQRSRIVSFQGRAELIRGYSADTWCSTKPPGSPDAALREVWGRCWRSRAVASLRCVLRSGVVGWFHSAWAGTEDWHRTRGDRLRRPTDQRGVFGGGAPKLPAAVFAAEYLCEFSDTLESVFAHEDLRGDLSDEVEPLFGPRLPAAPADGATPFPSSLWQGLVMTTLHPRTSISVKRTTSPPL